jgi:pseudouridine synthase
VGRLDYASTGLVVLTNDGALTQALLHPSRESEREYRVTVRGELDAKRQRALERGVLLEGERTAPARVSQVSFDSASDTTTFQVVLIEGRNRQIRRSLVLLGRPVKLLVRTRMGTLRLGSLYRGEARALRRNEIRDLLAQAALPVPTRGRRESRPARRVSEAREAREPGEARERSGGRAAGPAGQSVRPRHPAAARPHDVASAPGPADREPRRDGRRRKPGASRPSSEAVPRRTDAQRSKKGSSSSKASHRPSRKPKAFR